VASIPVKTLTASQLLHPSKPPNELEWYAAVIHALIVGGYSLTIPYHIKRKHYLRALLHLIGGGYHVWAVREHLKEYPNKIVVESVLDQNNSE